MDATPESNKQDLGLNQKDFAAPTGDSARPSSTALITGDVLQPIPGDAANQNGMF
ncbi:MAG: hypothetical protein HOW71_42615 [Nonomuraea sp.]|nr:hypothetical protein [Nonomuraea sp.]NUP68867.1 hypothetical protein [Nonomuraea sp.]